MSLAAVGLNHTTAPVELREQLAVPREQLGPSLDELTQRASLREVMLLSTCNRVEVYGVLPAPEVDPVVDALAGMRGLERKHVLQHCFVRADDLAARHIFRVAASLESMVVGEPQILGQVKEAYQVARDHGTVGTVLDRCMTMAFHGAKRARSETQIAQGGASIASVAVELATSIFGQLDGARVTLVGAGVMSQHAGLHMRAAGAGTITVVNRGRTRGEHLAEAVGGTYEPWEALQDRLIQSDVVICSTGANEPILRVRPLKKAMRKRRGAPLFIVDIAVPRDVEPAVGRLEQVFLYDVDDLQGIVNENLSHRGTEADEAMRVVDEEVASFLRWQRERTVVPVIKDLQERSHAMMRAEVERALGRMKDLTPEQQSAVESLGHAIVQKMLHTPITAVKEAASHAGGDRGELANALARLHGLPLVPGTGDLSDEPSE